MEKSDNLAEIIVHRGKRLLLTELLNTNQKNLTDVDKKIIQARTTPKAISQLTEKGLRIECDHIMARGAAISGCALPNTEFFADTIAHEIATHLKHYGYGNLTPSEIYLALRLNTRTQLRYQPELDLQIVPFHGVCFNVDFLSKVLHNYWQARQFLEKLLLNSYLGY